MPYLTRRSVSCLQTTHTFHHSFHIPACKRPHRNALTDTVRHWHTRRHARKHAKRNTLPRTFTNTRCWEMRAKPHHGRSTRGNLSLCFVFLLCLFFALHILVFRYVRQAVPRYQLLFSSCSSSGRHPRMRLRSVAISLGVRRSINAPVPHA